jgi:hypothetical protein
MTGEATAAVVLGVGCRAKLLTGDGKRPIKRAQSLRPCRQIGGATPSIFTLIPMLALSAKGRTDIGHERK